MGYSSAFREIVPVHSPEVVLLIIVVLAPVMLMLLTLKLATKALKAGDQLAVGAARMCTG
jgi:hypothetical protein